MPADERKVDLLSRDRSLENAPLLPEFQDRLKKAGGVLERLLNRAESTEGLLRLGPDYSLVTSEGAALSIKAVEVNDMPNVREYHLFAEDASGRIVGEEYFSIMCHRRPPFVQMPT
jgi:hypothetical protein